MAKICIEQYYSMYIDGFSALIYKLDILFNKYLKFQKKSSACTVNNCVYNIFYNSYFFFLAFYSHIQSRQVSKDLNLKKMRYVNTFINRYPSFVSTYNWFFNIGSHTANIECQAQTMHARFIYWFITFLEEKGWGGVFKQIFWVFFVTIFNM